MSWLYAALGGVNVDEMAIQDGGSRETVDRSSIELLAYQRRVVDCASRFTWSCWARQTGKSFTLTLRRVLRGVKRRRTQLFLSAGMRQTRELMLKVRQHCHALQIDASEVATGGESGVRAGIAQIQLPNGVRLIGLPAKPETVRGFTGDVLLDEFAMHADDRAIWAATFPTILRGKGELDVASTPKGRDNLFYDLQQNESFARSIVTLPQAVAQGLDIDIAAVRQAMGDEELFRQEFQCEFLDESEAFLPHRVIAACEEGGVERHVDHAALREESGDLYVGIDVARKRDFTVIWLWRMQNNRQANGVWGLGSGGTATTTADAATRGHGDPGKRQERQGKGCGVEGIGETARADTVKRPWQETGNSNDNSSGGQEAATAAQRPGESGGARRLAQWSLRCAGLIEMGNAPFVEQQEAIRRVLGLRCVRRCCIDATGMGLPLAEWAQEEWGSSRVEAVHFTAGVKAQMAGQLRRLAEEGRLRIPADEVIRNDWHSVRRSVAAGGGIRLDAARTEGGHADRFWAAALGALAAEAAGSSGPIEGMVSEGRRVGRWSGW